MCTLTSLAALRVFDSSPWAIAGAVGVAMGVMGLTQTFHPPADGDCVVVMLVQPSWTFLFVPVLLGCLVLLAVALVFHKLSSREPYPLRGGPTAASSHAAPHAN